MIKVPARFPRGIEARSRSLPRRRLAVPAGIAALVVLCFGQGVVPEPGFTSKAHAQAMTRPVGFADIVDKVKPAVISVRVNIVAGRQARGNAPSPQDSPLDRFFRRFGVPDGTPDNSQGQRRNRVTGQGSGFFISADGYAVTNFHVVENTDSVEVTTDDGRIFKAKVIGADQRSDIALIKIDGGGGFPFVRFPEASPRIGDWVIAVGNPFGLGGSVTAGIVSARGRDIGAGPYDDFIQIDASVNKGNSGGPTFDMAGTVIGVNTAIFSPSGATVGIAFDIPSDTVKSVVAQLKDKGVVSRGWIGVQIQPVTAEIAEGLGMKASEGALVAEPQAGSPAAKAGIDSGDVITAVNGHAVKDARDLARQIGAMAPGSDAKLSVWRKGEENSFTLTLGELPRERDARATSVPDGSPTGTDVPKLGLMLAPAGEAAASSTEGVVVTEVDPNGVASEHGFKAGDVILDVAGKKVTKPEDVRTAIADAHRDGKHTVLMRVKSEDATRFVAVPLGRA